MKLVALVFLQFSFLAGTLAATGDVGEACTGGTGGNCTNTHAYCNSNGICACKSSYVQKGTSCARVVDQPCGSGQCGDNLVCTGGACTACAAGEFKMDGICVKKIGQACTSVSQCGNVPGVKCDSRGGVQKCTCDTSANLYEGDDGDTECYCAPGYEPKGSFTCGKVVLTCASAADCVANALCTNGDCVCASGSTASGNNCVKVYGDTCAADADCAYTGGKCTGIVCACDTTGHFAAGTAGATSCSCDTGYTLNSAGTKCVGKIGTTCGTAADCIAGTTCTNPGSGLVCTCDTASHYATGSAGAATCSCDTGYTLNSAGTKCVGKIGTTCTTATTDCIAGTTCTGSGTTVCTCDTANHYTAGTPGAATCSCDTGYTLNSAGTKCVGKIGTTCTTAATDCIAGTTCTGSGTAVCTCDTANHYTAGTPGAATCSCASGYVLNTAGTACVGKIGSACATTANCISGAICDGLVCTCDTSSNYAAGKIGDATCSCQLGHVLNAGSTKCVQGIVGTPCTSADQCVDHALCTSSICVCDTSKGYKANLAGKCVCDTGNNYATKTGGSCGKTPTQPCTADTGCIDNAKCTSAACTCDATNHFIASGATCVCDSANNYYPKETGCGKKPGQACQTAADCVDNADCTNSLCTCNSTKGFAGTTACTCSVTNFAAKSDGTCGKYIGQTCATSADCIDNAVCNLATSLCACDADNGYSGSGASCTCSVPNWAPTTGSGCGKVASQSCEASPCADNAQCGAVSGMCECNSGFIADISKVCKNSGVSMASASSLLLIAGALLLLC